MILLNQTTRHTIRAQSRNTSSSWVEILTRAREFRPLLSRLRRVSLFSSSVELNARDTKLTMRKWPRSAARERACSPLTKGEKAYSLTCQRTMKERIRSAFVGVSICFHCGQK